MNPLQCPSWHEGPELRHQKRHVDADQHQGQEGHRRRVDGLNAGEADRLEGHRSGDLVTVCDGSFKGYEAILDGSISGQVRVRVLLQLLNRPQVALEVPGGHISSKKR